MLLSSTVSVSRSISTEILTSRHNPFMAPSFSFFIASISPLVSVLQVGSWPLSWLFSREKVRKSSFKRLWYLHYLFINSPCSVWSNLIALLFPRPTRSVSSGWAFFPLLIILLSRSEYKEQRTGSSGGVIWITERILLTVFRSHIT